MKRTVLYNSRWAETQSTVVYGMFILVRTWFCLHFFIELITIPELKSGMEVPATN